MILFLVSHAASIPKLRLPSITYLAILPELLTLGGALLMLGVSALLRKPMDATTATSLSILTGTASLVAGIGQWINVQAWGPHVTVAASVVQDGFSSFITITVSCAVIVTAFIGQGWMEREGTKGPEMHALMLVSAMGAMLMGEANDLILVFLGLEIMSIALYVLAAGNARRAESGEAGLKYFVLGAFSSAVFLYGMALVYGATGSTNLSQITDYLARNILLHNGLLLAGISLLLVGFAFKIAAVPFHLWTPDVYEGSPSPITGFMAAVAKAGGFAALLRVFVTTFPTLRSDWQPVIWVIAVLTLVLGAAVGIVQRDVKRMLAYSSINHAGFILLGLYLGTQRGVSGSLYYLFTYAFMVTGSFAVITAVAGLGDGRHELDNFRGLVWRQPWLGIPMVIFLLAQAGLPATTGLWAKIYVIEGAVGTPGGDALALIAMVSAVIAAFFYLRLVLYMVSNPSGTGAFATGTPAESTTVATASIVTTAEGATVATAAIATLEDTEATAPLEKLPMPPLSISTAVVVSLGVTVLFGVWPAPIVNFAHAATLLLH